MNILLTGASGFLGRRVLEQLADEEVRLLLLPDDPSQAELRRRAPVVLGDITRPTTLPPALAGITQVVHLAGHVAGGRGSEATFEAINTTGTANLARAASTAGVHQFIYPSSITVYGATEDATENASLVPTPGYAASKIGAERALRELLPLQATILRLPLLLGAGDTGFLCPALEGLRQARRTVIIGSGRVPWSVLAVDDAARAIALCLKQPATCGQTYNVVGATITNGTLFRALGTGIGSQRELRLPYLLAWLAAAITEWRGREGLTRLQARALSQPLAMNGDRFAQLGFVPQTTWQAALEAGIQWCAHQANDQSPVS